MYKKVDNIFDYDEIIKFVKNFLSSNGFDLDKLKIYEKEYSTSPAYGIETKHKWMSIHNLPAPFSIGEMNIDIIDDRISFKYIFPFKRYFTDEIGLKLYGPIVDLKQDAWYVMIPGLDFDDYYWNYKYGGLEGCQINSFTMKYIIDFMNKMFVDNDFICEEELKNKANKYINQLDDYSINYSKTAYSDLIKIVGFLWYTRNWLWSCVPKYTKRYDDLDQYGILRIAGIKE